jgi:ADP-ribose pyrophosphatase
VKPETSEIVWQSRSWYLRVDRLRLADGTAVNRGTVVHPGSVVLVPVRPSANGLEVLMLRQYRLSLDMHILELPAGTREWDEAWLACAQRELREETGYRAETFTHLGTVWPAPGITDEQMYIYLVQTLSPDPLPGDADEMIELTTMPLPVLIEMAQDGRLQDAKSVVGILRAAVHLSHQRNEK